MYYVVIVTKCYNFTAPHLPVHPVVSLDATSQCDAVSPLWEVPVLRVRPDSRTPDLCSRQDHALYHDKQSEIRGDLGQTLGFPMALQPNGHGGQVWSPTKFFPFAFCVVKKLIRSMISCHGGDQ